MAIKYNNTAVNNVIYKANSSATAEVVKKIVLDNAVVWEKPFALSESLATGCNVVYNRQSTLEPSASTGVITTASTIYNDDVIRITYSPAAAYEITSFKVNGVEFTSGDDYTVHSDVGIVRCVTYHHNSLIFCILINKSLFIFTHQSEFDTL